MQKVKKKYSHTKNSVYSEGVISTFLFVCIAL